MNKVFLSDWAFRVPGLTSDVNILESIKGKKITIPWIKSILQDDIPLEHLAYQPHSEEEDFITRRDKKVLSKDIQAGLLCTKQMVSKLEEKELYNTGLYTCTSLSYDRVHQEISAISSKLIQEKSNRIKGNHSEKIQLETIVPPLMGLRALTNSANSYLGEYFGIRGENTTFGNTSYGSWTALDTGVRKIQSGELSRVVIGAMNSGGKLSSTIYKQMVGNSVKSWREISGAVFVILENELEAKRRQISNIQINRSLCDHSVPTLIGKEKPPYEKFQIPQNVFTIHSGGTCTSDFEKEKNSLSHVENTFSWLPELGDRGVLSPILNFITAAIAIRSNGVRKSLCLDRDPFGRESLVELSMKGNHE